MHENTAVYTIPHRGIFDIVFVLDAAPTDQ